MKILSYNNFIVSLAGEIDRMTNHFIFDGYNALAALLKAPIGASIVLYIVLMGYAITRGIVQKPQDELFKFALRAGFIYLTALNWGFFSSHIKDLFVVGSESIANTLMKAVHHKTSGGSIYKGLQGVFNEVLRLDIDKITGKVSQTHFNALIAWRYLTPPNSPAARWQNWDGFEVIRYSKTERSMEKHYEK
jgi:type IV secretion system protein VirB6